MQRDLQMQDCNNGEQELDSEHASLRKEAEQLVMGSWKSLIPIVESCILDVGIHSASQVIKPIMDDWVRKIKDEMQSAVAKMLDSQNRNSMDVTTTPIPRDYKLKFLDQVSDPVFTGMKIKGKEGTDIKVALVDDVTEDTVDTGPESSATVEIFLDAGVEDFNNNPHFHKPINVKLEKGIGILHKNVKLGHKSSWIKRCECRLGARVAKIFDGSRIKEARTGSFTVLDRRSSLYKKHDQPSLPDKVWRLKNICKNGARHIRLRENNISTVQEFLFLYFVDCQRLQKIFRAGRQVWKGTVDHALKCYPDYKKMYSQHSSSSVCENGVVFAVGQLEGGLPNDSCVPIASVAEAEKDDARKSLAPAFENQNEAPAFENGNNVASFDVEGSLPSKFPCISNDKNATNSTGLDSHLGQYFENEEISNEPSFKFLDSCVPIESVAEAEKDDARKSLAPAFENQNEAPAFGNGNNMASFDVEASLPSYFPCISNDKNATNSTGLDDRLGHYFENEEISNEQPSEFIDYGPNSFYYSVWNFGDGYMVSL